MLRNLLIVLFFLSNYTIGQQAGYKFIENKNQWPDQVKFKADLKGGYLYLENNGFLFDLYDVKKVDQYIKSHHDRSINFQRTDIDWHAYKVEFINSNKNVIIKGNSQTDEYYNYFLGNDPEKWAANVNGYFNIQYDELYEGIDLSIYSSFFHLKYDLIISPNANTDQIKFKYVGQDDISIKNERLHIYTKVNHVIENKPYAYQIIDGETKIIECRYILKDNTLSYEFPDGYDKTKELIIDPTLIFSTYSGSFSNNFGYSATFDSKGFLYSGSSAFGNQYPTTTGAYNTNWNNGIVDIAISKFDTTGTFLIYSTFLGGNNDELPHSLIVNSFDELFILGTTSSINFPFTIIHFFCPPPK